MILLTFEATWSRRVTRAIADASVFIAREAGRPLGDLRV